MVMTRILLQTPMEGLASSILELRIEKVTITKEEWIV